MIPKNILFLIPDGMGIRNYLYSNLLSVLKDKSDFIFWSTLPLEAFNEVKNLHQIDFEFKQIKLPIENIKTRLFRESVIFARLIHNTELVQNSTILNNWNYNSKGLKLKILMNLAQFIGKKISKNYNAILKLEQKSRNAWDKKIIQDYKKELQEKKIIRIFITHQRVANLLPICLAAQELGIEVVTVIYSWDNLPKARLNVVADKYLVWSEYMKKEMQIYYPEISQEKVIVTGTPQFEFYNQKERIISRDEFAKKYNLNSQKKWILYSGDDILTSPYDQDYLNDLTFCLKNKTDIQLIFRRCPADFSTRFDEVLNQNKELIISIDPDWNIGKEGWGSNFPKINDVNLLVNLAYHCETVINVGSTMAFDFGMFNKSCFYLNYNQPHAQNWSVETIYNFQHFRSMPTKKSVGWINSKEDFYKIIDEVLNQNSSVNAKEWFKIIVNDYQNVSKNIQKELLS